MPDFLLREGGSLSAPALIVLIVVIAVLLVCTVVLSAYAIMMRFRHAANAKAAQDLKERWRDPVLGAVADPTLVPSVQGLVGDEDAIPFLGFVIEYARRVRGEEKGVLRDLVKPFLPRMVERAHVRRVEMRAWAIQTLGTLGLPEYEDEVVAALDDPSELVAMVAARGLARQETPQYASAVLERLDRFSGWNRHFLASMLAAIGPSASEVFRTGLADEGRAPWIRGVMAEALLQQGDFLAGDTAAEVVRTVGERDLLASALRLLTAVGRPEHAEVIRRHCDSEDTVVRAQAFRALGSLGGQEDVPVLVEAMGDQSPWPALYAARGARDAGGRAVLAGLVASGHPSASLAEQVLAEESGV